MFKFPMNFFPSQFSIKMTALAYCYAVGTRIVLPPEPNAPDMESDNDPRILAIAEGSFSYLVSLKISMLLIHQPNLSHSIITEMKKMVLQHSSDIRQWYSQFKSFRTKKVKKEKRKAKNAQNARQRASDIAEDAKRKREESQVGRGSTSSDTQPPVKDDVAGPSGTQPSPKKRQPAKNPTRKSSRNGGKK